jgi:hypothetical protein
MKKLILKSMMLLSVLALTFTSCSDNDDKVVTTPVSLSIEMPLGLENIVLSNAKAVFTNVTTNETFIQEQFQEKNGSFMASLADVPEGTYNVAISGDLSFTKDGIAGSSKINQKSENVSVKSGNAQVKLAVNTFNAKGGFVISEIFFTGTLTPEGKQYSDDQYFILSNNSDVTLYADSIAVLESKFLTVTKYDYNPDIMNEAMTVDAIYMIPGKGTEVAVEPGKSLVLALNAKNHTEANSASFDLSKADYEFYDESSNPRFTDDDNASVPNLDKWYCSSLTYFSLHNRGFKTYAIARMHGDKEKYLKENTYDASYVMKVNGNAYPMTAKNCIKVPNSWILDAVNLSIASMWQWNLVSANLDAGWAHCGQVDKDENRYGKSVIRKKDADGKWVDTNNSTYDFESDATVSFLKK